MPAAAQTLADYSTALNFASLPPDVVETAKFCLIDAVACAAFGARLPWSQIVLDHAKASGSGGPCVLPGVAGVGLHVPQAALALGTFSHAFELDSLRNPSAGVHPGATVALPALALAQQTGADGSALLAAIVAGCEVMFRIGLATRHSPEERGFHAPGLIGPFGAATACAKLMGLSVGETANALGIAGSLGGGLLAFAKAGSGGMVKRLHMGRAAEAGVTAASLAARGFEGPPTVLDGRFGFLEAYCNASDTNALTSGLGEAYEIRRLCIKQYACHVTAHAPVQLLRELMAQAKVTGDDIEGMTIAASAKVVSHHSDPRPGDVMLAQYSQPFTVALAAYLDPTRPEVFNKAVLRDERILSLAGRIRIVKREQQGGTPGVEMRVRLADGRKLEGALAAFRGCPEDPFTTDDLAAKFERLTPSWTAARRSALFESLMKLEQCNDIRALPLEEPTA